ncbi:MAG: TerB family tellurite resistance protein [Rhodospirillales bacterium]
MAFTPLEVKAIALAYVALADGEAGSEEKAVIFSILGKHVRSEHLTPDTLKVLAQKAFAFAKQYDFNTFLEKAGGVLSPGQQMSVLLNMYDIMLADGQIAAGEKKMIDLFRRRFDIDDAAMTAFRQILILKNDAAMFTNPDHPCNEPNFKMDIRVGGSE